MEVGDNRIILRVDDLMKSDRPGKVGHELTLRAYPVDRRLCIVETMKYYLEVTKAFRHSQDKELFLSIKEPHKAVTKDTIAWWIREMLALSGIDVNIFKAHSVRSASVSKASSFVPTEDIMARADWTQEKTFRQYYNKPVLRMNTYDEAILSVK